jgi:hypothetical protein
MRAVMMKGSLVAITTFALACTVVSDDENPFGTAPPPSSSPPIGDTGDATETSGTGSGSGGGSSSGVVESTGMVDGGSSSGMPLTTGVSAEDSTTDGGGNGMQPGDGMWSACAVPEDCGFVPTLCITINDAGGMLLGGFCSETGCANPAADCDPSPVPTVVPVCVPVTVEGEADMACALQCTGGAACPVPMQCRNVTGFGEVCA